MNFNNPRYLDEEVTFTKPKIKNMSNAITYLESVSEFGEDGIETVTITEAHRAVYLAKIEALEEAKEIVESFVDIDEINILINKYKKKI